MDPETTGRILLRALNKQRKYITDACASARHAVCNRWAHTARVRRSEEHPQAQRTPGGAGPPAPPSFLYRQSAPATRTQCGRLKPLVWLMDSGQASKPCFPFLPGVSLLSIWSVQGPAASQALIPERSQLQL